MKAHVTSLPAAGRLYQLSQPYRKYGRGPKYEPSTEIKIVPVEVTDKSNRIVYVPPSGMTEPNGQWASFHYKVVDSASAHSYVAKAVVVPTSNVLVGSDFSTGTDDWVIRGNGHSASPIAFESSRQAALNHFVHAMDETLNINSGSTSDSTLWKFCVPAKFKGNHEVAYGGSLEFTLGSFSGNFVKLNERRESVVIECTTCNLNKGMRFVQRDLPFDGKVTDFKIELTESAAAGWLKDPHNENVLEWASPTACEMVEMLSHLSEICILGDHTKWYESVGLDSVAIKPGAKSPPTECLCTNPGTQCTA